jgi:predicted ATPase
MGYVLMGWADAMNGDLSSGIADMQRGMEQLSQTEKNEFGLPSFYAQIAQLKGRAGDVNDGLAAVEEGLALADRNGDYFSWPELQRIKGELVLMESADRRSEAIACFQNALRFAKRQKARMLELRAATALAELWDRDGRREESYQLVAPLYGKFSEGFNTVDLSETKDLLDHLS